MRKVSIPNILSVFRLLLLPVFVLCYLNLKPEFRFVCAIILVVSGLTDILDGFIARKFHMETQLGRILDPLADKLTLFTVALTLAFSEYKFLFVLAGILFLKEFLMLTGGVILAKNYNDNKVEPSKWYGKLATAMLYVILFAMILIRMNQTAEVILALIMSVVAVFAFIMYLSVFIKIKNR